MKENIILNGKRYKKDNIYFVNEINLMNKNIIQLELITDNGFIKEDICYSDTERFNKDYNRCLKIVEKRIERELFYKSIVKNTNQKEFLEDLNKDYYRSIDISINDLLQLDSNTLKVYMLLQLLLKEDESVYSIKDYQLELFGIRYKDFERAIRKLHRNNYLETND